MIGNLTLARGHEHLELLELARRHQRLYLELEPGAPGRIAYETGLDDAPHTTDPVSVSHVLDLPDLQVFNVLVRERLLVREAAADYEAELEGKPVHGAAYKLAPAGMIAIVEAQLGQQEGPVAFRSHTALPLIDQPVYWSDLENSGIHVDAVAYYENGYFPRLHSIERIADTLGHEVTSEKLVTEVAFKAEAAYRKINGAFWASQQPSQALLRDYTHACELLTAALLTRYLNPNTHTILRAHDPMRGLEAWFLLPAETAQRHQAYFTSANAAALKHAPAAA